jgi:hypothetical protein
MISRQWRGLARSEMAAAYQEHLQLETFPAIRKIDGFVDAGILKRPVTGGIEFSDRHALEVNGCHPAFCW